MTFFALALASKKSTLQSFLEATNEMGKDEIFSKEKLTHNQ